MLKVYLTGFKQPVSVIGDKLYEDERHFVLQNEGIKSFVRQDKILYIEDVGAPTAAPPTRDSVLSDLVKEALQRKQQERGHTPAMPANAPQGPVGASQQATGLPQALKDLSLDQLKNMDFKSMANLSQIEPEEETEYDRSQLVDITVNFVGAKEHIMALQVPQETIDGAKYNPSLAKEIFSNPKVQSEMGDFILSGVPKIEGRNVFFETRSVGELKNKLNDAGNMLQSVVTAEANSSQAGKMPDLSLSTDFKMPGSPFEQPVQFSA